MYQKTVSVTSGVEEFGGYDKSHEVLFKITKIFDDFAEVG
jgi:hypothetical protein